MAAIRLDQVNLVVQDVRASRAFYSRLGLDFGDESDLSGNSKRRREVSDNVSGDGFKAIQIFLR